MLSPIDGTVIAVNENVRGAARAGLDPYAEGWLLSVRPSGPGEPDGLLCAEEYEAFAGEA